jgi:hypothetical protein
MAYSAEDKGSIWTLYRLNYSYRAIIASINVAHGVKINISTVHSTIKNNLKTLELEKMEEGLEDFQCEEIIVEDKKRGRPSKVDEIVIE